MQRWIPIPKARGYFADEQGNIKGPRCVLKPTDMANGYLGVKIAGKSTTVHAGVAAAFHGLRPSILHTVNHKNGNKRDNRPSNLEWVTHAENMRHAIDVLGVKFGPRKEARPKTDGGPEPGTVWRRVVVLDGADQVLDGADQVLMDAVLYVPLRSARCDQLAGLIGGQRMDHLTTATEIAEKVRGVIGKRPSVRLLADMQREELKT